MADFARGQLLVDLREKRHLSQEDAAHEIGTTAKSLRAWEHGGKIRWDNAKRLGEFYGIDPEQLVSRNIPDSSANGDDPFGAIMGRLDEMADQLDAIEARLAVLIPDAQERDERPAARRRTSRTTGKKRAAG